MHDKSARDFLFSSPIGEFGLITASIVRSNALDDDVIHAIVLSDGKVSIFGVNVATILGPFAHRLGASVTRNGNGQVVIFESLHIIRVITGRFG